MKKRRSLKQRPALKVKRKMTLVYATAGIALAAIIGVGFFIYLNLGSNTDSKAAAADFTSVVDGFWSDGTTWSGGVAPSASNITSNIEIFKFVTRSGDLSYSSGSKKTLTISDTLVIIGNLTMGNKSNVTVNTGGVLIVTGNFTADNKIDVGNGGIIAVGGDLIFPSNNQDSYNGSSGDLYVSGTTSGNGDAESADKNDTDFQNENNEVFEIFNDAKNGTLPISLNYFKAQSEGSKVLLEWETAEEVNNDYFTIERSVDGMTYEAITTISGAGNSHKILYYAYSDPNPIDGVSYYRLRQTDFDGRFEVFKMIAVQTNNTYIEPDPTPEIGTVAPNPFQSSFRVEFNLETSGVAQIQLTDLGGDIVASETLNVYSGHNQYEFNRVDRLNNGIYLLRLVINGIPSEAVRVIKR